MDLRKSSEIIKTVYYVIENIILLPVAIILILMRVIFNLKFVRLIDYRIGHLAGNTELLLRRIQLGIIKDGATYIGIASTKPCNKQLLKMFKRVMPIIQLPRFIYRNTFFEALSNDRSILNKLGLYRILPFSSNHYYEFNEGTPTLRFTESEERKGKELLKKMGLTGKDWFVCFHARDPFYLKKSFKKSDTSSHDHRNSNINNYLKAAEYVASKGGFAIRMGADVEKELSDLKNAKIVDYASKYRTDFGDIYLSAKCKFFLGSTAGIELVADIFNVPLVQVNRVPLVHPSIGKGDIFIPKKIFSKEENRVLKFKEVVDRGFSHYMDADEYFKSKIVTVENTPEEILDAVIEMNERIDGKFKYSKEDEVLQKRFRDLINKNPLYKGFPSRAGTLFLRENKELLE